MVRIGKRALEAAQGGFSLPTDYGGGLWGRLGDINSSSAWQSFSNGFFGNGSSNGSSMSSGMGMGGGRYAEAWSNIRDGASSAWNGTSDAVGNWWNRMTAPGSTPESNRMFLENGFTPPYTSNGSQQGNGWSFNDSGSGSSDAAGSGSGTNLFGNGSSYGPNPYELGSGGSQGGYGDDNWGNYNGGANMGFGTGNEGLGTPSIGGQQLGGGEGVGFGSNANLSYPSDSFNDRFNGDGSGSGLTPYGGYDGGNNGNDFPPAQDFGNEPAIGSGGGGGNDFPPVQDFGNEPASGGGGDYQNGSDQGLETDYANNETYDSGGSEYA